MAEFVQHFDQAAWDRNQELLARRQPSKLRDRRRPSYLLSGLVKCGVCGGAFNQISVKMGCTTHRMKGCSNGRRVRREDLERAVFDGLTRRLLQPQTIEWFIPEYMRERGSARAEGADRRERAVARYADVGREIDNLIAQMKVGAIGYAASLLNDNLNTLGAEKERLSRELRDYTDIADS